MRVGIRHLHAATSPVHDSISGNLAGKHWVVLRNRCDIVPCRKLSNCKGPKLEKCKVGSGAMATPMGLEVISSISRGGSISRCFGDCSKQ